MNQDSYEDCTDVSIVVKIPGDTKRILSDLAKKDQRSLRNFLRKLVMDYAHEMTKNIQD
jgi:hypothetical protein